MNEKDYQEAINIMAVWRHEELTRGAANLLTFVYNKTYGVSHD